MKVISFSQLGPRAICILSANGVISSVTLRQADSSGGTLTYEVLQYFKFCLVYPNNLNIYLSKLAMHFPALILVGKGLLSRYIYILTYFTWFLGLLL